MGVDKLVVYKNGKEVESCTGEELESAEALPHRQLFAYLVK